MIWPIYNLTLSILNTVFVVDDVSRGSCVSAWGSGAVAIGCALTGAIALNKRIKAQEAKP